MNFIINDVVILMYRRKLCEMKKLIGKGIQYRKTKTKLLTRITIFKELLNVFES